MREREREITKIEKTIRTFTMREKERKIMVFTVRQSERRKRKA